MELYSDYIRNTIGIAWRLYRDHTRPEGSATVNGREIYSNMENCVLSKTLHRLDPF